MVACSWGWVVVSRGKEKGRRVPCVCVGEMVGGEKLKRGNMIGVYRYGSQLTMGS